MIDLLSRIALIGCEIFSEVQQPNRNEAITRTCATRRPGHRNTEIRYVHSSAFVHIRETMEGKSHAEQESFPQNTICKTDREGQASRGDKGSGTTAKRGEKGCRRSIIPIHEHCDQYLGANWEDKGQESCQGGEGTN